MEKEYFGTIFEEYRWEAFKKSGDINSARCFIEAREEAKLLKNLSEENEREI